MVVTVAKIESGSFSSAIQHFRTENTRSNYITREYLFFQHGISQEDVLRGRNVAATKEVTYQLASVAHVHLDKVRYILSVLQ